MTEDAKRVVAGLREDLEWARANEWETPITLGDHLEEAADLIESLFTELEQVNRERDAAVEDLRGVCRACIYYKDNEMPFCCYFEDCANGMDNWDSEDYWQWRGVKEE